MERTLEDLLERLTRALEDPKTVVEIAVAALGSPTRAYNTVLESTKDKRLAQDWRGVLMLYRDQEKYGVGFQEVVDSFFSDRTTSAGDRILENQRSVGMKTVIGYLRVALKKDVRTANRNWLLPIGTPIDIYWISEKRQDPKLTRNVNHIIQFFHSKGRESDSIDTDNITWEDVEHPQDCCIVFYENDRKVSPQISGNCGVSSIMNYVYCATLNDFLGIECGRSDIACCPLCGRIKSGKIEVNRTH